MASDFEESTLGPNDPRERARSLTPANQALARLGYGERSYDDEAQRPRLMFVKDLKRVLQGIGDDTIYALLNSGEIPARKVGNKWLTTPEAVDAWLQGISDGKTDYVDPADVTVVR